jgi:pyruvate kinase
MKEKKIICTLGSRSLNKKFLSFSKNKISLLKLNMSHLSLDGLKKTIKFVKKNTTNPIRIEKKYNNEIF